MPYQKTKEGRLVNEITLGDGYPLSNDKQPLKVGGEASIINVSSPTPDGSVDGEVEIKGKLKAKDTIIQGNIKAFTDDDTTAQFVFESTQGANNRFDVKAAANTRSAIRIFNNQGYFELRRDSSTTSLKFTDGTNTPLILDGDNVEFTNLTDGSITIDSFVDEDNMSSNSATKIPTQQSVKAYVDNEVAGLVDSAPAALDTLNELAAALNDDASFSTTITNSLAAKVGLTGDETVAGHKKFSDDVLIAGTAADPATTDHVSLGVSSGALRIHTDNGYTQIGPTNANWSHFYTDRDRYYFNKPVIVDGEYIASYDEDLVLRRVYNDTSYNQITIGDDTLDIKLDNTSRLAIDGDGQVDLSGDLMLRGEGGIFIENSATANGGSIIQPAGGMYRTGTNTHTGAIKITVPRGTGNPTDMISFWVDVFDYGTNQAFTAYIAGYVYQDEGSNEWHNVSAQIFGNLEQNNYTIRFGHDTNNHCVLIGETTTSWNYMQVTVRNVQVGYSADIDDYKGDWTITFETSLPTIDETLSDNLTLAKGLKSSGSIAVTTGTSSGNDFAINTDTLVVEGDNNRVGIGTASPSYGLDVANTARFQDQVRFYKTSFPQASFSDDSGTDILSIGQSGEAFYFKTSDTANNIRFRRSDNEDLLELDMSELRVGINTTSPQSSLHVEEGDIRIDTASGATQALRFSEANTTKGQLQYRSGDEELNLITVDASGTAQKRVTIKSEQDATAVGIGTTSPSYPLHVKGGRILVDGDGSNSMISLQNASGNRFSNILNTGGDSDSTIAFQVGEAGSPTEAMIIHEDGNVGIGTSSPNSKLHIEGSDHTQLQIKSTDGTKVPYLALNNTDMNYHLRCDGGNGDKFIIRDNTNSANRLAIDTAGKVGIGTISPTTTLDVEGTVSYKHIAFTTAGPTDNVDVSGTTVLECDTSGGHITIGGFTGGVQGQILYIVKTTSDFYRVVLENNEGGGSQDIFSSTNANVIIASRGGVTLYCNGTSWFILDK